ncbi:unnamed protein product, partial [Scytosiphon promiscuus]
DEARGVGRLRGQWRLPLQMRSCKRQGLTVILRWLLRGGLEGSYQTGSTPAKVTVEVTNRTALVTTGCSSSGFAALPIAVERVSVCVVPPLHAVSAFFYTRR